MQLTKDNGYGYLRATETEQQWNVLAPFKGTETTKVCNIKGHRLSQDFLPNREEMLQLVNLTFNFPLIHYKIYQGPNEMHQWLEKLHFVTLRCERLKSDKILLFFFSFWAVVYARPSFSTILNLFNYLYYQKVICLYSYTQFHIFAITINHIGRRKSTLCQLLNHLNN